MTVSRLIRSNKGGLLQAIRGHRPALPDAGCTPPPSQVRSVRCREIAAADLDEVTDLLTEGFRAWRDRAFWVNALNRLSKHRTPPDFPKYGYVLESNGMVVGVLLLIFTLIKHDGKAGIRCNVSSWYVRPKFRFYASLLSMRAQRHKQATYYNITPAPWTLATLEAQGYVQYCKGAFVSIPLLSFQSDRAVVEQAATGMSPDSDLSSGEIDLLLEHAAYGCVSVVCNSPAGRHPFVFVLLHRFNIVKYAVLIYCRHPDDFTRFASPLGRFLAQRGIAFVVLDANGPVKGLVGYFSPKYPKYFKGEQRPGLGDLAFSERALLGV